MEQTMQAPVANNTDWFKHWFNSSFYHQLYAHRNQTEAASFIDRLLQYLQPSPDAHMLDLGCGSGRHSHYLAAKGFNVTGLDLAASSIYTARQANTPGATFLRGDMRLPFGTNRYHYVFNFFTSFGYFKTDEEDDKVISNIATSLKPGGVLMMDYLNTTPAEKRMVPNETKYIDGVAYNLTRWQDNRHFFKKIMVQSLTPDSSLGYIEQVKKFSLEEMDEMFCRHGLQLQQVFGNYQLDGYDRATSPRLILLAKKK